ncbi:queuosine-tRNA galactosyltransferase-like [Anticarsia gemmatalis]|uniref:queuosine-tRNA galactosyltransferase-like n=1 Tax=Anticarsia gemmatalis TaxID=129554 RepID=UPI003F777A25
MAEISIIIPVYNGERWIDSCMKSIASQTLIKTDVKLELAIYNDGSNDGTQHLLEKWKEYFTSLGVTFAFLSGTKSKGVGAAKNSAVKISTGRFLCFQDIDDVMHPERLRLQWETAKLNISALVGCKISRVPANSTPRFVRWANTLTNEQLKSQIYTSNGPTLLMPTWFCHRSVYDKVGGFDESGYGTPEDLIFFYDHLDAGGHLVRVDEELLIYTYHEGAATFSIKRELIWKIQLDRLENYVLPFWNRFTVWNAGKWGRRLVRSLSSSSISKVDAFCDVDKNKIGRTVELYCPIKRKVVTKLPVVHFTEAKPPLLICMKLDLTNGEFERNLKSLNLIEGVDYVLFS